MTTPATRAAPALSRLRSRWATVPLRARLVGILLALLIVALAVTGWATQYVLKGYLVDQVDQGLARPAAESILKAATGKRITEQPLPSRYVVLIGSDDDAPWLAPTAPRLAQNPDLLPRFPTVTEEQVEADPGRIRTVPSVDGRHQWRLVTYPLREGGYTQVALPLDDVTAAVDRLRLLVVLFGLVVTAACAALGWLAIRK